MRTAGSPASSIARIRPSDVRMARSMSPPDLSSNSRQGAWPASSIFSHRQQTVNTRECLGRLRAWSRAAKHMLEVAVPAFQRIGGCGNAVASMEPGVHAHRTSGAGPSAAHIPRYRRAALDLRHSAAQRHGFHLLNAGDGIVCVRRAGGIPHECACPHVAAAEQKPARPPLAVSTRLKLRVPSSRGCRRAGGAAPWRRRG
jgi:hypothetical protein